MVPCGYYSWLPGLFTRGPRLKVGLGPLLVSGLCLPVGREAGRMRQPVTQGIPPLLILFWPDGHLFAVGYDRVPRPLIGCPILAGIG